MIEEYQRITQIIKSSNIDPTQIEDVKKYILAGLKKKYEDPLQNNSNLTQDSATQFNYLEQQDFNRDSSIQNQQDNVENVVQNLANQQQNLIESDDSAQKDTDSDPDGNDHQAERGTWAYFFFSPKSTFNREFYKFRQTIVGSMFSMILIFFIHLSVTICFNIFK